MAIVSSCLLIAEPSKRNLKRGRGDMIGYRGRHREDGGENKQKESIKKMKEIAQVSSKMAVALCIPRGSKWWFLWLVSLSAFGGVSSECFASSTLIIISFVNKISCFFFLAIRFPLFAIVRIWDVSCSYRVLKT